MRNKWSRCSTTFKVSLCCTKVHFYSFELTRRQLIPSWFYLVVIKIYICIPREYFLTSKNRPSIITGFCVYFYNDYYSSLYCEDNGLLKPNSTLETSFTEKLALTSNSCNLDNRRGVSHCTYLHRVKSNLKTMDKADSFDSADYSRFNEDHYHAKREGIHLSPTNNNIVRHQGKKDAKTFQYQSEEDDLEV